MQNDYEKINEHLLALILLLSIFSLVCLAQLMSDLIGLITDSNGKIILGSFPNLLGFCFAFAALIIYLFKLYVDNYLKPQK